MNEEKPLQTAQTFRGGSWFHFPRFVRSASRYGDAPGYRVSYRGFRLVLRKK